jgi:hypothetical protein
LFDGEDEDVLFFFDEIDFFDEFFGFDPVFQTVQVNELH